MNSSPSATARHLLPRWRSLSSTIQSRELARPGKPGVEPQPARVSAELLERLENWRLSPSILHAAELVETALVYAQEGTAVDAARLLVNEESAVALVRNQAALLLKRSNHFEEIPSAMKEIGEQNTLSIWRSRTRLHPQDALAWVELGLAQIANGSDRQAERSLLVALSLAPHNRHVLRSTARFFVPTDPERAHLIVLRNAGSKHDPWLMAAEVGLAKRAQRKSRFLKAGLALLESETQVPRQVTELAGAIGTTLLTDGNTRRGKQLLRKSLLDPTGNSLAQVEWISQHFEGVSPPDEQRRFSEDATEARALHCFEAGDFEASLAYAELWMGEEPSSIRAPLVASSIASMLEKYGLAEKIAHKGLRLSPRQPALLNGLAFFVACQGKLSEAEKVLRKLEGADEVPTKHVTDANWGLIALRQGQSARGKELYRTAIAGLRKLSLTRLERLAEAYFAREVARAGLPDAEEIVAACLVEHPHEPVWPEVGLIRKQAERSLQMSRRKTG